MHRVIAALMAVTSCASIAQAQTATSPPSANQPIFSLDRARTIAGGTSPTIESAAAGLRSAAAGRTIAGLRPNPQVQVQTENIAGSGLYRGTRSAETTATLALPIELGGKRSARIAVADSHRAGPDRCGNSTGRSEPAHLASLYCSGGGRTTGGRCASAGGYRRQCI